MRKSLKIGIISLVIFVWTSGVFVGGAMVGSQFAPFGPDIVQAAGEDQPEEFATFWQVWNLAQRFFIDREALDNTQLTYGAINGLIQALGDEGHTRFLTPEEVTRQRTDISGKFFGIGAQVGVEDGLPVIVTPLDGSPAEAAGIQAGDIIIEVDGEDVTTFGLNEVVELIRGEEGVEVVLTIFRPDISESLEISIIRGEIRIDAATWTMIPGTDVALIRMSQFSANLKDDVVVAVEEAEAEGATRLIVDVRNNPGGLLDQAINVTSQFLTDGNVLLQEDAEGNREAFEVREGGVATEIPLVVLANRGSASSAEIFAGAIQDHERGIVIGETTFGTGTVLTPYQLDDGSAILLGTSQWLTAEGRLIRKQGIAPDIEVTVPAGSNLLSPFEVRELTVSELLESEDAQLLRAIEELDALPEANIGVNTPIWESLDLIK